MSEEETVIFKVPRGLVESFELGYGPRYWRELAADDSYGVSAKLTHLVYAQTLEWQQSNWKKISPTEPVGTEVKDVSWGERLEAPIRVVGADPAQPAVYAVVVDGAGLLRYREWEHLRVAGGSDD